MKTPDVRITQVHVDGHPGLCNVTLGNGQVLAVAPVQSAGSTACPAVETLDGEGGYLSPAFVDAHTHMEKALIEPDGEYPTLDAAVAAFGQYSKTRLTGDDITKRATRLASMAVKNGTLALRTHIRLAEDCGLMAVESVLAVREAFAPLLDIQVVAMLTCYGRSLSTAELRLMDAAATAGVNAFGVAAHLSDRPESVVDQVLDKSGEHGLLTDFHVDETDEPDIRSLKRICTRMEADAALHGRVTAGHLCALAAVENTLATETIARMAAVNLHVAVMPSCNLYLMGRHDGQPQRRGVTRVRELLDAGVNVACASDNVRDHFRPFGNADLLEEGLLLAQVCQFGTPERLRQVYRCLTTNPAQMLGFGTRGVFPGAPADLVLLPVRGPEEALVAQPGARTVIRRGHVVYTRQMTEHTTHNLLQN